MHQVQTSTCSRRGMLNAFDRWSYALGPIVPRGPRPHVKADGTFCNYTEE
jgi:hypothetical protein